MQSHLQILCHNIKECESPRILANSGIPGPKPLHILKDNCTTGHMNVIVVAFVIFIKDNDSQDNE